MKTFMTTASVMMTLALMGGTAHANSWGRHIDELANDVMRQSASVTREIQVHFRGIPEYRHLYQDAHQLYMLASHVHDVAHQRDSLRHIQADVAAMDEHFHHLQEVVAQLGRTRHRGVGIPSHLGHGSQFGSHGTIGVNEYHLRRLHGMMQTLEESIHHLQEDVDMLSRGNPVVQPRYPNRLSARPVILPAPVTVPRGYVVPTRGYVAPTQGYVLPRSGGRTLIQAGNGRFSFSVGIGR